MIKMPDLARLKLLEAKLGAITATHMIGKWEPKPGTIYTINRNDLEFFRILSCSDGQIFFRRILPELGVKQSFPREGFVSEGFGLSRIYVLDQMSVSAVQKWMEELL